MYVELHAHSAFSFLDGASLPDELAAAAVELGYDAFALTDHDGLSGSMEFAQAAAGLGLRAIHGAEMALEDGRHLTLLVEDATAGATSAASSRAPTRTTATRTSRRRACRCADARGARAGARLPERLRAPGRARRAGAAAAARRLRRRAPARRAAAAVPARRPGAQPRASPSARSGSGVPTVATGNVHAHARARAPLQDAFVALRNHTTLDASEPLRRGNFSHVLASPEAMAARFADDHPRGAAADPRARRPPDLRPHPRPRLPLPRLGGPGGLAHARRALRPPASRSATRPAARTARGAAPAWRRSCA